MLYGVASRWWGSDRKPEQIEIDVVSESIDKKYLLVGECKWTAPENAGYLLARLKRKASLLPFAANHIIVPVLFLKSEPSDFTGLDPDARILFPDDVIDLSY